MLHNIVEIVHKCTKIYTKYGVSWKSMIIKNADVFTEEGVFERKDIYISEGYFSNVSDDLDEIEGENCWLIPGLTDIHFHGCAGYDFCDGTEEAIQAIADYEAGVGVTTIIPATMTLSEEKLIAIAKAARAHKNEGGAVLCGIYLEGPFISHEKKGAQNERYIHRPDIDMFHQIQKASGGMVKFSAIAPEVEGALEFIENEKENITLSIAHSNADYETAKTAIQKGVTHITHLYNAMNPISHRAPGIIIAAADDACCEAELICDGIHVHPAVVRNTLKMFGDDRIIFVSDSMRATGLKDGCYELGGQPVIVKGNLAVLEDGTIAGSNTNLMECMIRAAKEMEIPLETAVKCAAVNSAKSAGIYDKYGSITIGKVANAVLLNKTDLSVKKVILKGKVFIKS